MTLTAYGLRKAVPSKPMQVDLTAITYDPEQQISVIEDGGMTLPALRHTTGTTSTNTATRDNAQGSDSDSDQRED